MNKEYKNEVDLSQEEFSVTQFNDLDEDATQNPLAKLGYVQVEWLPGMKKALATLTKEIEEACECNNEIRGIFQKMTPDDFRDLLQIIGYSQFEGSGVLRLQEEAGKNYEIVIHERFMCYILSGEIINSKCHSCKHASRKDYNRYGWLKCTGCVKQKISPDEVSSMKTIFGTENVTVTMNSKGNLYTDYCIHNINSCENYRKRFSPLSGFVGFFLG